jgi:hypothetical protein
MATHFSLERPAHSFASPNTTSISIKDLSAEYHCFRTLFINSTRCPSNRNLCASTCQCYVLRTSHPSPPPSNPIITKGRGVLQHRNNRPHLLHSQIRRRQEQTLQRKNKPLHQLWTPTRRRGERGICEIKGASSETGFVFRHQSSACL